MNTKSYKDTKTPSVGYLGPAGTFTEEIAVQHFGKDANFVDCGTIEQVFQAVADEHSDYGVVPIENSIEGGVRPTLDCLSKHYQDMYIVRELALPINLHLLALQDDLSKIEIVHAHQQALAQARQWLQGNLSNAQRLAASSNAAAAKTAAQNPTIAAIASRRAAEVYDLRIIRSHIHDTQNNTTRFFVIGNEPAKPSGHDKTSLLLATTHKAGSLAAILQPLARHGINMTHIESRPLVGSNWKYVFFLDMEGSVADSNMHTALKELEKVCDYFKLLGSYPRV